MLEPIRARLASSCSRKGIRPVSYTHLDVYKRQAMYRESSIPGYGKKNCPETYFSPCFRFILPNREAGMFLFFIRMLDVYKRQQEQRAAEARKSMDSLGRLMTDLIA